MKEPTSLAIITCGGTAQCLWTRKVHQVKFRPQWALCLKDCCLCMEIGMMENPIRELVVLYCLLIKSHLC